MAQSEARIRSSSRIIFVDNSVIRQVDHLPVDELIVGLDGDVVLVNVLKEVRIVFELRVIVTVSESISIFECLDH